MRRLSAVLLILALTCINAHAAMFGDIMISDSLNPQRQAQTGHGGRIAVAVQPEDGAAFVVYLPETARDSRPWTPLQAIAHELQGKGDIFVFSMGGRPWFGTREIMPGDVAFFDGYTHRNGILYNIAFSIDNMLAPDADVKLSLSLLRIVPGIANTAAMQDLADAADYFENGEWDEMEQALANAESRTPSSWYLSYLRGRLAEGEGDFEKAQQYYSAAASLSSQELEPRIREASALGFTGTDGGRGSSELLSFAAASTEEPLVWEELGKVYLAAGETETARGYFEEAAAVNPASELALYNLSFIHAENGDYENALRRAREFMYYFPWMPTGVVPDVTGAPGMTEDRIRQILSEPLPLGRIARSQQLTAPSFTPQEVETSYNLITVPQTYIIHERPAVYAPVIIYDWGWSPRLYRPWYPGTSWFHRPRPPIYRPGRPVYRPRPPSRPSPGGPSRPSRPRPPVGPPRPGDGNRPGPGSGGRPGQGERPRPGDGGRPTAPGQGGRPGAGDTGGRPGQGERPRPGDGGRPTVPGQGGRPGAGDTGGRPGQGERPRPGDGSRPTAPDQGGRPGAGDTGGRPGQGERPRPGDGGRPSGSGSSGNTGGNSFIEIPLTRPDTGSSGRPRPGTVRPTPIPAPPVVDTNFPGRPARPGSGTRPSVTRPAPATPPAAVTPPTGPAVQPARPAPSVTRPAPTRPAVTAPPAGPQVQPARPAPGTVTRPAPSVTRPAPTTPAVSRPAPAPARPAPVPSPSVTRPAPAPEPARPAPSVPRPAPSRPAQTRPAAPAPAPSRPAQTRPSSSSSSSVQSRPAPQQRQEARPARTPPARIETPPAEDQNARNRSRGKR